MKKASRIEAELRALYAVRPERFVTERNERAARLVQEGRRAEAARLKKARKPTARLAAINALARHAPVETAALLEAADALLSAQRAVQRGQDRGGFKAAMLREREALAELLRRAGELPELGAAPSSLSRTLRASAQGPREVRQLLREGRLESEPLPQEPATSSSERPRGQGRKRKVAKATSGSRPSAVASRERAKREALLRKEEARRAQQEARALRRQAQERAGVTHRLQVAERKAQRLEGLAHKAQAAAQKARQEADTLARAMSGASP